MEGRGGSPAQWRENMEYDFDKLASYLESYGRMVKRGISKIDKEEILATIIENQGIW